MANAEYTLYIGTYVSWEPSPDGREEISKIISAPFFMLVKGNYEAVKIIANQITITGFDIEIKDTRIDFKIDFIQANTQVSVYPRDQWFKPLDKKHMILITHPLPTYKVIIFFTDSRTSQEIQTISEIWNLLHSEDYGQCYARCLRTFV